MKHAPAPWTASATVIRDANGHSIASAGNNRHNQGAALIASLRLAAAAPELLEALEALTACTPETYDNRHELAAARDAIAKAKGEA